MDRPKKKKIHSESSYLDMKVNILLLHLSRLFFQCTCKCIFNFLRDHGFVLWHLFMSLFFIHLKHECLLRVSCWRDDIKGNRPCCSRAAGERQLGHGARPGWWPRSALSQEARKRPSLLNHPVFFLLWDWFFYCQKQCCHDDVLRENSKKRNSGSKTIF